MWAPARSSSRSAASASRAPTARSSVSRARSSGRRRRPCRGSRSCSRPAARGAERAVGARVTASVLPALLLAGCAERIAVPADTAPAMSSKAWEALVSDAVDERGLVDYARIERKRDVLDSWLAGASSNGPLADEWQEVSENKRLAFMINAHNAAVVLAVITK